MESAHEEGFRQRVLEETTEQSRAAELIIINIHFQRALTPINSFLKNEENQELASRSVTGRRQTLISPGQE